MPKPKQMHLDLRPFMASHKGRPSFQKTLEMCQLTIIVSCIFCELLFPDGTLHVYYYLPRTYDGGGGLGEW